jgi:hypothetical protein
MLILENSAKTWNLPLGSVCMQASDATQVVASKKLPMLVVFFVI